MKKVAAPLILAVGLLPLAAGTGFATGQPGASAGVACTVSANALQTPGNAGTATNPAGTNGSPFNQAIAKEYAGNQGSPTTSNGHASGNAVSQYDIACLQVSKQVP